MKVTTKRTTATIADIAGYLPLPPAGELQEVVIVRSPRNRLGGGPRARPQVAQ